jgi:hypothetical protein
VACDLLHLLNFQKGSVSLPCFGGKAFVMTTPDDVANEVSHRARAIDLLVERLLLAG